MHLFGIRVVWLLRANKKIESYSEQTFLEKIFNVGAPKIVSKEKFIETFNNFKDNPLNSMKSQFTAEQLKKTVPGTDVTLDTFLKKQSEQIKELYNINSLNIELK